MAYFSYFPMSWTWDRGTGHPQSGSCIVSGMVKGSTASFSHPQGPLGYKPSPKHQNKIFPGGR